VGWAAQFLWCFLLIFLVENFHIFYLVLLFLPSLGRGKDGSGGWLIKIVVGRGYSLSPEL